MEAGRHPLDIRPLDLSTIARSVVADAAGRAVLRGIKLTVALPENAHAFADAAAAKRIIANLLSNALQYTPDRGAVRTYAQQFSWEETARANKALFAAAARHGFEDRFNPAIAEAARGNLGSLASA